MSIHADIFNGKNQCFIFLPESLLKIKTAYGLITLNEYS
jgi:hypothetical protein